MSTPAGWYPDPNGTVRWWDGYRWTEALQPTVPPPLARVPEGTPVATVWIWLIALLPIVGIAMGFGSLVMIRGEMTRIFASALHPSSGLDAALGPLALYTNPWYLASLAAGLVLFGLMAWFAYLDEQELLRRGFPKTFPWAWVFLNPVYIIGRSIVVRRQAGRGLAPLWTFIAIEVVWLIVVMVWTLQLAADMMRLVSGQFGAA